jgi:hypothetical protein
MEGLAGRELNKIDREIASTLIDTGAVNFEALGKTIASVGPNAVLMDDDGWIRFCGSDMRIFRWPRQRLVLEDLLVLREMIGQLSQRQ